MLSTDAARARFRHAGRQVLAMPTELARHEARLDAACDLDGAEPLQGSLADMMHACDPDPALLAPLLQRQHYSNRLLPLVASALLQRALGGIQLPRSNTFATRWSVITEPSLDIPQHAMLCSVDDSREIAKRAVDAILTGEADVEADFLTHCAGSFDTLAFMLARRMLMRRGYPLSTRWDVVSRELQTRTRS